MDILIAFGPQRKRTAGLAAMVGDALRDFEHDAAVAPAKKVRRFDGVDVVIVAGALYARRHRNAPLRHAQP